MPSPAPNPIPRSTPSKPDILPGSNKPHIPRPLHASELPEKYRYAERRIRTIIIALPIAIVTSWVLWKRLVQGEERKRPFPKSVVEIAGKPGSGDGNCARTEKVIASDDR